MIKFIMRCLIFLISLTTYQSIAAQSTNSPIINIEEIHQEIDSTVWRVFQKAYEERDAHTLNNLYAEDVIRVAGNSIDTESIFKQKNINNYNSSKQKNQKVVLDFWLDARYTNAHTSYEIGYFRITKSTDGMESDPFYGQFHIVLQKINGQWKITQDVDTDSVNGKILGAEDFNRKPIRQF